MIRRKGVEYRRGQRPTWLDEPEIEETHVEADVEKEAAVDDVDTRRSSALKSARTRIQVRVSDAYIEGDENRPSKRAPVIEVDDLQVPEAIVEVEEDDVEERRRRARLKSAQVEMEVPSSVITELEEMAENEEFAIRRDEEQEDETEEEEEESESDHDAEFGRVLMKPVFVSKANRCTVVERGVGIVESAAVDGRNDAIRSDERKKEIEQKVIDAIQRDELERELAAKAAQLEIPDDTDLPDDPVEYEKWRLREMVRILRDREARRLADEERAETERRRLLPDAVIIKEHEEQMAAAPPKPKIKFLQRYHHKGVFYTDFVDQDLLQRDHLVATGTDAEVDRSLLPKVLQVKNFGLASRTKYTHLTEQDTSRDNPWAEAESFAKPSGFSSARTADTDRDTKRPRTT